MNSISIGKFCYLSCRPKIYKLDKKYIDEINQKIEIINKKYQQIIIKVVKSTNNTNQTLKRDVQYDWIDVCLI